MERLSSGKQINSASDDAAGFAIAERMTAQIRGLNMAAKNAGDGLSMLSTIENATNDVTDMLQRVRELAVQAVNDTNSSEDRGYLQTEVTQLVAEIDRVATDTQYNGRNVFVDFVGSGSGESAVAGGKIQVGTEANQTIDFTIDSISSSTLGVSSINVSTGAGATSALSLVDAAIEKVAGNRAEYGAVQNRLEYSVSNLLNVAEFTTAARSRIEDADFAAESARLSKAQVLQQSGTAMLAQANASQQLALSLFQ
jgi:flagellin